MAKASDEFSFWAFGLLAVIATALCIKGLLMGDKIDMVLVIAFYLPVAIFCWIVTGIETYICLE